MTDRACSAHPLVEAEYQCSECRELLCGDCVKKLSRVAVCRRCGELALAFEQPPPVDPLLKLSEEIEELDHVVAAGHDRVVVPTLTIIVIFALSVYVLEARTLLLPANPRFLMVGFWFVIAVISIARFEIGGRDSVSARWYSFALSIVTGWAMSVAPWWKSGQTDWWAPVLNIAVMVLIWWFGTALIHSLSEHGSVSGQESPGRRVGQVAVVGLGIFAFLEPLVAGSPRSSVDLAFLAVLVFLFATGVLLAVASARRLAADAYQAGAESVPLLGPLRALMGALILTGIIGLALALPFEIAESIDRDLSETTLRGARVAPGLRGVGVFISWALAFSVLLAIGARLLRLVRHPRGASWTAEEIGVLDAQRSKLEPGVIAELEPREAVVVSYHLIAETLATLGYERRDHQTPLEYLLAVPSGLSAFSMHLDLATSALASAVYNSVEVTSRERDQAIRALVAVRDLAASRR